MIHEVSLKKAKPLLFSYYMSMPDKTELEKIECEGFFVDLYLGELDKIVDMPADRAWKYEPYDIRLKLYSNEMTIEFKTKVKHPDNESLEVYKIFGKGPLIGDVGFIIYSYEEINTGSPNWKGVMVLRIPKRGMINGYWLTIGVNNDDKCPIGKISLKRKI